MDCFALRLPPLLNLTGGLFYFLVTMLLVNGTIGRLHQRTNAMFAVGSHRCCHPFERVPLLPGQHNCRRYHTSKL